MSRESDAIFDKTARVPETRDVSGRRQGALSGLLLSTGATVRRADARFLIVGLAPGMHGANRTGRPFTGDHAGILLYQMLHKYGFASRDHSEAADDGLELIDCRITNAVKCLPPDNKPVGAEINTCNAFLANELQALPKDAVVMALGGIAHRAIIKALGLRQAEFKFAHAAVHDLEHFSCWIRIIAVATTRTRGD